MKKPKLRPRNPLVAIAITRGGAGAHDKTDKARRRKEKVALQRVDPQRELNEARVTRGGDAVDDGGSAAKWHRQGDASAPLSLCRVAQW
jgi:hypothetical protein